MIVKSQDRLTELIEVRGSLVGFFLHDEIEQIFVLHGETAWPPCPHRISGQSTCTNAVSGIRMGHPGEKSHHEELKVAFGKQNDTRLFVPSTSVSEYLDVPYADLRRPPITRAELERARAILTEQGERHSPQ